MSDQTADNWAEANRRYLAAALAEVRGALARHAEQLRGGLPPELDEDVPPALDDLADAMSMPPALATLCATFGLSAFERGILLLCAGVELDADFAAQLALAQGDGRLPQPTFGLALAALPNPDWNALSPAAPLRHWRLIEAGTGNVLTQSALRIDERVLHYLTGVHYLDERLVGFVEAVPLEDELARSQRVLAERIAAIWSRASGAALLPGVQLAGPDTAGKRAIAAAACALIGLDLYAVPAEAIPADPREREALVRLWEREAALSGRALLIDCGDLDANDPSREHAIARLIESVRGVLLLAGRERRSAPGRPLVTVEVRRPTADEQQALWQARLGDQPGLSGQVEALVGQFNLSAPIIQAVCAAALGDGRDGEEADSLPTELWETCRLQARPRIESLAQRIEPVATWDDIVLPEQQRQMLHEMSIHVHQRTRVYQRWGFAAKSARGLGISALFAGPSGTGKTMAAEVLANELRLDLYRIDLSQVVSKYIGETEKNLRRVFDAAEDGGAILLFDEADALFGKRSEVKDSHDRYANVEISYLLQRMEDYRGLAILTTNMKQALDPAFLRRIRFVVQFPFPDTAQRAEIWRRIFPVATPVEGLDPARLAQLNVAGGNIRNIALGAAFLAADEGAPVRMAHLLRAARSEFAKLEKPLTNAETSSWM
jgi:ATPase family associated with various cellular activities (AAA)